MDHSCFCKLFTYVLNNRLSEYIADLGIMGEEQTGFRHDYSTMDHVFVLKNVIDLYLNKRKRLYCAFVDYRKYNYLRINFNYNGRFSKADIYMNRQTEQCYV